MSTLYISIGFEELKDAISHLLIVVFNLAGTSIFDTRQQLSTRIKDAGIATRHSRGRILFYTAGSRNRLEGLPAGATRTKS